jgi:hypothetical protein
MIRLDPAHPPLWRDADTLQFGLDDVARLEDPQPWELRLLDDLGEGLTDLGWAAALAERRIPRERADALLAELQPALMRERPAPRVVLQVGRGVEPEAVEAVAGAMRRAGAVVSVARWPEEHPVRAELDTVVLLAPYLVEPARAAALLSADIPHLPLVLDGGGAHVGPLVRPGVSACTACEAAHARDADAAWPIVASQLVGRPCTVDPDVAAEAARVAVQLLTGPDGRASRSVRLRRDDPHRAWQTHRPHEDCGCRSLGGSATASDPSARALSPSSSRASALPA